RYPISHFLICFYHPSYAEHRDLHSFPTRRSSDLEDGDPGAQGRERSSFLGQEHLDFAKDEIAWLAVAIRRRLQLGWSRLRIATRSEEHTSELQSRGHLVCRLLLEKKKKASGNVSP